jgi:hypothetical protein
VVDAVAGKEESAEAGEEGEVSERGKVVVGEVDCILVLGAVSKTSQLGISFLVCIGRAI